MPYQNQASLGIRPEEKKILQKYKKGLEKRAHTKFSWGGFLTGVITGFIADDLVHSIRKELKRN